MQFNGTHLVFQKVSWCQASLLFLPLVKLWLRLAGLHNPRNHALVVITVQGMIGLHAFLFLFKRSIYSVRKWHNSKDTQHTYSHLLSAMIVSIILEFQQKQMLLSRTSTEVQMNRKLKYYKGKGIMIEKSLSYWCCFVLSNS